MDILKSIYPPPSSRLPLPTLYTPTAFLFLILPWLLPKSQARILITLPILITLVFQRPFYKIGTPTEDYNSGTIFFAWLLGYCDFLTPSSEEPRYYGPSKVLGSGASDVYPEGTGIEDCHDFWDRLKWALRLCVFGRGIGWNWQVKNVPAITDAGEKKWRFVQGRLLKAISAFGRKIMVVYLLGAALALQNCVEAGIQTGLLDAAVGWLAAAWAWHGMKVVYEVGAAASVSLGICDQWEWPPLFGDLKVMWSVRQAWSVVWHQLTRRMLNQPAILLTRFLGLKKGTLASRYAQLYLTFLFSLFMHWWLIFNATGDDANEFPFFMMQPVAITVEDFVQWCWRQYTGRPKHYPMTTFEKCTGWIWTIIWFSISLPPYAKGLVGAKIAGFDTENVLRLGLRHADEFLRS